MAAAGERREPRRRRFTVSLVVEGRVASEIDGIRRALGAASLQRIAPHITLIPPVNVAAGDVPAALEVCRAAAAASGPVAVELGPTATFFPPTPVVYLAVAGDVSGMESLRRSLSTGPLTAPRREFERPFVPHVTLNQRSPEQSIAPALAVLGSYRATYTFTKLTLLEQDAARRWRPAADFPLGPPHVIGRGGLELEMVVVRALDEETARIVADEWEAYSLEQYGPGFAPDDPYSVVARREGAVVAVASGEVRGRVCELARLVVGRAVRRQGLGSHVLRAVERLAAERGCRSVRLRTIDGGSAEDFYAAHGYVREVVLPAWREGRDFVVMSRPVADQPAG